MTFTFELVTPEKLLFSREVEMVVVPGTEGDFGVLKGHAPLISTLRTGVVEIHAPEEPVKRFCVSGGFTEVTAGRCTVLATDSIDLGELTKEYVEQKLFSAGTDEEKQAVIREIHAAQSMMSSSKQH